MLMKCWCTGHLRYELEYSKRTKKWIVKPIAEHKQHDYLLDMMEDVIKLRLHGRHEDTNDIDTPIDIPRNIAAVERPNKCKKITEHVTRYH